MEGFDPAKDPLEVRKRISVVIQESAADLFLSVVDNFATFGRFHGLSPQSASAIERKTSWTSSSSGRKRIEK